jgi:hypothetical protein
MTEPAGPALPATLRSALTLGVLGVLLLLMLVWGWSSATAPLPGSEDDQGACEPFTVVAGERLDSSQVEVSILNAGNREGLAGEVMDGFVERGFREGSSGNAPTGTEVAKVQIWAADRRDPAVELVRSALPQPAPVVDIEINAPGVVVVVGNDFGELREGRTSITARQDGSVCAP